MNMTMVIVTGLRIDWLVEEKQKGKHQMLHVQAIVIGYIVMAIWQGRVTYSSVSIFPYVKTSKGSNNSHQGPVK